MQKKNVERKECEGKEKKRKEVRGINLSKVVEARSLKLDLDLLWKDLEVRPREIIEDYKTLIFSNFQKIIICFVRVMGFWRLCVKFGFLVIFLKKNFESRTLGSYRSQRIIHVRKISSHLLMYWERSKYLKFQLQFWDQFLLKVITLCDHHQ